MIPLWPQCSCRPLAQGGLPVLGATMVCIYSSAESPPPSPSYCCTNTNTNTLKCLNWLPLAGRRLSHRCTAVENAIKGDIPQHFESFKSTLRSSHGYNTRHGYLPRLPKPKTEWGKRVSYSRFVNDWMSLPVFLRKPMPCTIFKKTLTRFLMDKHF